MQDMPTPTTRELEILKVLWELGPCSVRRVHRQLAQQEDLAYNTVQTLMRIMEEKGLVDHQVEGRTFIYTPRFSRDESTARFLDRVFLGLTALGLFLWKNIGCEGLQRCVHDEHENEG